MKQQVNTYSGLNKDNSLDSIKSNTYLHAEDIKIVTEEGTSNHSIINVKGNKLNVELPGQHKIIGATNVRNTIVTFTTTSDSPTGGHGYIWRINYENDCASTLNIIYDHLDLKFSTAHPIEAIGRYENDCIQRVIFSDYNQRTKTINIASSDYGIAPYNNIIPSDLDLHPNASLKNPILNLITGGGNLFAGIYQYAFKLLNVDGKETIISNASKLISLYSSDDTQDSADIFGDAQGTNTGKSIEVKIDLSNTNVSAFENITLIRIFRDAFGQLPTIKEIDVVNVDPLENEYTIVDSGSDTGAVEITYENYITNSYPFYTNKTFASKDNLLLISNIKEDTFEVTGLDDTSFVTERFTPALQSHTSYMQTTFGLNAEDALYNNPFNDDSGKANGVNTGGTFADWTNNYSDFKYQADGVTLGGESPNGYIKYSFINSPFNLDLGLNGTLSQPTSTQSNFALNNEYVHINENHSNFASSYLTGHKRGYKRGETYRFGIVFFSEKGTASFVYYIGDIRMPDVSEMPFAERNEYTTVTGFNLGLEFEVNLPTSIQSQIAGYKIVRVDRDITNSTRLYQGILVKYYRHYLDNTLEDIRYHVPPAMGSVETYAGDAPLWGSTEDENGTIGAVEADNKGLVSFFSPEQSYNAFTSSFNQSTDVLRSVGYYSDITANDESTSDRSSHPGRDNSGTPISGFTGGSQVIDQARSTKPIPDFKNSANIANIDSYLKVQGGVEENYTIDGNLNFYNGSIVSNDSSIPTIITVAGRTRAANQGTNIVLEISPEGTDYFNTSDPGSSTLENQQVPGVDNAGFNRFLIEYHRYLVEQYGGVGPNKVSNNIFIPCTNLIESDNTITVFGGDIYVSYFEFLRLMWSNYDPVLDDDKSYFEAGMIPVESRINLNLRHGKTVSNITDSLGFDFDPNNPPGPKRFRMQELGNEGGPMFEYNKVYSETDNIVSYFPKPINFNSCSTTNVYDVRTLVSDPKINGETIDSWTSFRANNFLEVNTQYGAINRLLNFNDEIYYIQDRGFGRFSINPRAVVATSDNQPTELGTGAGLVDFYYVSTKYGAIHQWACLATNSNIWFFDAINKKLMRYGGNGGGAVSDAKGLKGFFNRTLYNDILLTKEEGGDNPIEYKGIHCTYDYKDNQVIFTFLGNNDYYGPFDAFAVTTEETTVNPGEYINIEGLSFQYTGPTPLVVPIGNTWENILQLDNADRQYIIQKNSGYTVAFNELTNSFESFYKYTPTIYLNNNYIYSPNSHNGNLGTSTNHMLYRHKCGEYGVYYDEDPVEAMISIVINDNADYNKILRFLEFNSSVNKLHNKGTFYNEDFNGVVNPIIKSSLRNETISGIRIYNDQQDTGKIDLSTTREFKGATVNKYIKRKFDKWRVKIPRNAQLNDNRPSHSNINLDRMRSTYFIVELFYQNNNNKSFKLDRIISYYDFQMF